MTRAILLILGTAGCLTHCAGPARADAAVTPALVCTVQHAIRWRDRAWSAARCEAVAAALNATASPVTTLAIAINESDLRPTAIAWHGAGVADVGLTGVRCILGERGRCTNGPARGMTVRQLMDPGANVRVGAAVLASKRNLEAYNGAARDGYAGRISAIRAALDGEVVPVKSRRVRAGEEDRGRGDERKEIVIMSDDKCNRCSDTDVKMGIVKPIPCPDCGGSGQGKAATTDAWTGAPREMVNSAIDEALREGTGGVAAQEALAVALRRVASLEAADRELRTELEFVKLECREERAAVGKWSRACHEAAASLANVSRERDALKAQLADAQLATVNWQRSYEEALRERDLRLQERDGARRDLAAIVNETPQPGTDRNMHCPHCNMGVPCRYQDSAESGPFWRCSECGEVVQRDPADILAHPLPIPKRKGVLTPAPAHPEDLAARFAAWSPCTADGLEAKRILAELERRTRWSAETVEAAAAHLATSAATDAQTALGRESALLRCIARDISGGGAAGDCPPKKGTTP